MLRPKLKGTGRQKKRFVSGRLRQSLGLECMSVEESNEPRVRVMSLRYKREAMVVVDAVGVLDAGAVIIKRPMLLSGWL